MMKIYGTILTLIIAIITVTARAEVIDINNTSAHTVYGIVKKSCSSPVSYSSYNKKTRMCTITYPAFLASSCNNASTVLTYKIPAGEHINKKISGVQWPSVCIDKYCYDYSFANGYGILRVDSDGSVVIEGGMVGGKKKVITVRSTVVDCFR